MLVVIFDRNAFNRTRGALAQNWIYKIAFILPSSAVLQKIWAEAWPFPALVKAATRML